MTTTHIALYAGSFDPITLGHLDVIRRSRRLFDEIVVGVGQNPDKSWLLPIEERTAMASELVAEVVKAEPGSGAVRVESYAGLTVDFARDIGATALLRGLRNATDTAAECQLALANRHVADIETVFVLPSQEYGFTSSSLIRQIVALGGDLKGLQGVVPQVVIDRLRDIRSDESPALRGRTMEGTWGVD
ncbi:MAG: pantetheine-phosphate adenylyltransferase [Planctomycetota bacterium]|nr:pantetheine-phosphate adenylyltransferase [Planctomycetota bacterium]